MTDQEASETTKSAASKLFDIRVLIGGLFTLYGVLLTIYSFFTSEAELQKAAGININLGLGLGMLGLGLSSCCGSSSRPSVRRTRARSTPTGPRCTSRRRS